MKAIIIEDNKQVLEDITLPIQIRWPNCEVVSTPLGKEGIDLVKSDAADIVILELGLPDMSGFDVLEQIRRCSNAPVLILSYIRGDEAEVVRALDLGANGYMVRPFGQMELLARINAVIRRNNAGHAHEK